MKLSEKFAEIADVASWSLILFGLGVLIGIGQVLSSDQPVTTKKMVGRALSVGGLTMGACALLIPFPTASMLAIIGAGAVAASIGTDRMEGIFVKIVLRILGHKGE